jgi:hypothetical protein
VSALALGVMPAAHAAETAGVSVVADETDCNRAQAGSSNPSFYASNHRMVVTAGGRQLALYDAHDSGQQLAWRDPGGSWVSDAAGYLAEDLANDRPGSIALARDAAGAEHAWLVWAGYETVGTGQIQSLAVEMRRLSSLDASGGPTIGPEVQVWPTGLGNLRPDIAFENGRGVIAWIEKAGSTSYELKTTSFDDLSSNAPAFTAPVVVARTSNAEMTATLVETPEGVKIVARTDKLRVYTHSPDLSSWSASAGVDAAADVRPSAVDLGSGDILAALGGDGAVKVVRFASSGASADIDLAPLAGHKQPSLATDGARAWLFMIRSDGDLVSRVRAAGGTWSAQDALEVAGDPYGDDLEWPNLMRDTDGWLRLLLDGRRCAGREFRNEVLAYQRSTGDAPPPPPELPSLSVNNVTVTEANRVNKAATFTVSLSQPSSDTVTVAFATRNGSAVAPADYGARAGSLSFAPGVVSKRVSITVKGERVVEGTERFFLRLSGAANATISDNLGRATIIDND